MGKNEDKRSNQEKPYEPTPEELEEMFEAQQEEEADYPTPEDFEVPADEDYKDHSVLMHCKPVYNFQSIEFDIVVDTSDPESKKELEDTYRSVLDILQRVAVDQPAQVKPRTKPRPEDRPSDSQIYIMDKFGIKHDEYTTKKEAQDLIDESCKKSKEKSK